MKTIQRASWNSSRARWRVRSGHRWVGALVALGLGAAAVRADVADDVIAVSAKVSSDYVRVKLADGSYRPETYTFGEGGQFSGPMHDFTIDQLKFIDVAQVIMGPLADRKYVPSKDPKQVKLLVMVYWGTTAGAGGATSSIATQRAAAGSQHLEAVRAEYNQILAATSKKPSNSQSSSQDWGLADPPLALVAKNPELLAAKVRLQAAQAQLESSLLVAASENRARDRENQQKAAILGYDAALAQTEGLEFTARGKRRQDLIDELEDNRYYVVLMAYDFQTLLKDKKHRLLWETRFSVRERGKDFSRELASMAAKASRYFGEDSHGLVRRSLPEGHVKLDELEIIGTVPSK